MFGVGFVIYPKLRSVNVHGKQNTVMFHNLGSPVWEREGVRDLIHWQGDSRAKDDDAGTIRATVRPYR